MFCSVLLLEMEENIFYYGYFYDLLNLIKGIKIASLFDQKNSQSLSSKCFYLSTVVLIFSLLSGIMVPKNMVMIEVPVMQLQCYWYGKCSKISNTWLSVLEYTKCLSEKQTGKTLFWVCHICLATSVRNFRTFTVPLQNQDNLCEYSMSIHEDILGSKVL